jgi:O-antigen/teichoic acid export membrane protein
MDRSVVVLAVGRVLQIVIALLSVRVFTTLLSPAEVGNLYLINTIVALFALGLLNPVGVYMNRRVHKWSAEGTLFDRLAQFNLYLMAVAGLSVAAVFLLRQLGGVGNGIALAPLMLLVALSLYLNTCNQLIIPILNLLQQRTPFVVFSTLTLALGLGCSVLLVTTVSASALYWLAGPLVAQGVVTAGALVYLRRVVPGRFALATAQASLTGENMRSLIGFAFPLMITTIFMWLQNQSYRMVVEKSIGPEFLGMLGLGLGIAANIASAAESLVQQICQPLFYSQINTSDPDQRAAAWNRMAQLTLPLYASLTLLVSALAPFLVQVLAHRKFGASALFVVFGAWIELFRMTTNVLTGVAHAEMQTRSLVKSYLVGSLLAVVGVCLAVRHDAYRVTVPGVLVVSGLVTMAVMYHDMKRLLRTKVGIRRIIRSVLLSVPFLGALMLQALPRTFWLSAAVVAACGGYFLVIQYRLAKPLLAEGTEP